jgi:hypothetical protein
MTEEQRKEMAQAVDQVVRMLYGVEHRLNHQFAWAEMNQAWPLDLTRDTAIQDRAALTRALTILVMQVMPALADGAVPGGQG